MANKTDFIVPVAAIIALTVLGGVKILTAPPPTTTLANDSWIIQPSEIVFHDSDGNKHRLPLNPATRSALREGLK